MNGVVFDQNAYHGDGQMQALLLLQDYLNSFACAITANDSSGPEAVIGCYFHPEFICDPVNVYTLLRMPPTRGNDPILSLWHADWKKGTYSKPSVSNWFLINRGVPGYVDCIAVLTRNYLGGISNFRRDVIQLMVNAVIDPAGAFLVFSHRYDILAPALVPSISTGAVACSRSQLGQDRWVLERFQYFRGGFFLEIGAYHAELISNTVLLEEAADWSGICVDPFPGGDWSSRKATLVRVAVGPDGETHKFVAPGSALGGLADKMDMEYLQECLGAAGPRSSVEVETQSLRTIFEQAGAPKIIHYFSLDTEGSEMDILRNFPFKEYTLLSLTVEVNSNDTAKRKEILQFLEEHDFQFDMRVEHDDFYVLRGFQDYL
eukprot:TRINITY_DN64173_c0_g1_i1.p1 TRINITY_DN64173_c0_g1~~TRINITY_DN64173_c0_g1_i1.p1  ORF type:complete len:388 (+),score=63.65 TRINITY_DN64173_c0_g1_i1:42-1166(+)